MDESILTSERLHTSTQRTMDVKGKSTLWCPNKFACNWRSCSIKTFVSSFTVFSLCILYMCLYIVYLLVLCMFRFFCWRVCVRECVCVLFCTIELSNYSPRCLYYESSHLGISIMYSCPSWSKEKLQPPLLKTIASRHGDTPPCCTSDLTKCTVVPSAGAEACST